jgi:decaprenyl-phosphate phosphoribosyltransferase
LIGAFVRSARPRQWIKNLLILAAPGAAGVLGRSGVLGRVSLALIAFICASAAGYLWNDVRDREADRLHPKKSKRPIASGQISPSAGTVAAGALFIVALLLATPLGASFVLVLGIYLLLTSTYSLWLKNMLVVDLVVVASGFVLRAIAGAVAGEVPVSNWFLIVTSFGSLLMVSGRRIAELIALQGEASGHRKTLSGYSLGYLDFVAGIASAITILAYCLWAFEDAHLIEEFPLSSLSIIPFVLAILRYALLVHEGQGGAPEEVLLADRPMQVFAGLWLIAFAIGVYG